MEFNLENIQQFIRLYLGMNHLTVSITSWKRARFHDVCNEDAVWNVDFRRAVWVWDLIYISHDWSRAAVGIIVVPTEDSFSDVLASV